LEALQHEVEPDPQAHGAVTPYTCLLSGMGIGPRKSSAGSLNRLPGKSLRTDVFVTLADDQDLVGNQNRAVISTPQARGGVTLAAAVPNTLVVRLLTLVT
jgi:hypothetical protein